MQLGKPMLIRWHKSGKNLKTSENFLVDRGELSVTLHSEDICEQKIALVQQTSNLNLFYHDDDSDTRNADFNDTDAKGLSSLTPCKVSYNDKVLCNFIIIPGVGDNELNNELPKDLGGGFSYFGHSSHECDIGPFPCPFDRI